jgi:hypothetical protein
MTFNLEQSIEILDNTPKVLSSYLLNLSNDWLKHNEGAHTWSPYDILGHLIYGEQTDWMVRIQTILSDSENKLFEPFDRFAQLENNQNQPVSELLEIFSKLRAQNIKTLKSLNISETDFTKTGIHPEFGKVTLAQLMATWVVHDLGHIAQISRVMAKQYKTDVGPWIDYLGVLKR